MVDVQLNFVFFNNSHNKMITVFSYFLHQDTVSLLQVLSSQRVLSLGSEQEHK